MKLITNHLHFNRSDWCKQHFSDSQCTCTSADIKTKWPAYTENICYMLRKVISMNCVPLVLKSLFYDPHFQHVRSVGNALVKCSL